LQQELEDLFQRLVCGPEIDATDAAIVRAWLGQGALDAEDRAYLQGEFKKLVVYRNLVRGTLREALELAIPRSIARLGALFDEYFDAFLSERGPQTHYLRDVTCEFLDFCAARFPGDDRVPPWAIELARHEALRIEIGAMPVAPRGAAPELSLDHGLYFSPACRIVRYEHAVHRLSGDEADRSQPAHEPTHLFVYRSPEHEVRYLELTVMAASILERLISGDTLRGALENACTARAVALDQTLLDGTARLLADLAERGALLGAREIPPATAAEPEPAKSGGHGGA